MKILLLTQFFDPEPTFKGLLFAKKLHEAGHEVEVLTSIPNYPGGKFYAGYKIRPYQREIVDGINIHRVFLYPSHNNSGVKRALSYVSFALSSFIFGLFIIRKVDVIYSYHPPLTTSISASLISFIRRKPFIMDIQDLWPDTLSETGMLKNKFLLSIVSKVCSFTYNRASKIAVLSPGFKKKLIDRNIKQDKIEVIYNWCNEGMLNNNIGSEVKLPNNNALNLLFAGNLGPAQDLPTIIDAAKIIDDIDLPVNFVFLGDGLAKAEAINKSKNLNLKNTFFLPRVSMEQVGSVISKADILLVHLKDSKLFEITIPSRTQANLAMGKPILMGMKGDAAELILDSGAGLVTEPGCPKSLAEGVIKLTQMTETERFNMGKKGKNFYYNKLSLDRGVEKFIKLFESCA